MRRAFPVALIVLLLFLGGGLASIAVASIIPVPSLTARVTDQTGTLSASDVQSMEATLAALEKSKGSQIAVLIVPTTGDETIEQYSIRVVDAWKLGRRGIDDGALVLVAKDDRKVRIEVGRGLEGVIPDAIANRIIDEAITPKFHQGDFAGGLDDGITRMIGLVNGEQLPPPQPQGKRGGPSEGDGAFSAAFFAFMVARLLFGKLKSFVRGGLIGIVVGAVALIAGAALGFAAVLGFIAFLIGLISSFGGGNYAGGGGWGGWGGGSSGGFGGGFSGGGGGFSGGGASGGW